MRKEHNAPEHYTIGTFAAMVGLPQSKVRFYERSGLLPIRRLENGYRYFLPEDAFRMNEFRVLRSYGFSVEEAVQLLEENQSKEAFRQALKAQRKRLFDEQERLKNRITNIERTLDLIKTSDRLTDSPGELEQCSRFSIVDCPDYLFVRASHGRDFSISVRNAQALAEFVALMPQTRYLRIIRRACFESEGDVDPDYIVGLPVTERWRIENSPEDQLELIKMGRCLCFLRRESRTTSVHKETYAPVFTYLREHGYRIRGDMLLFPTFLNLDGEGTDIEYLYIPIE